MTGDRWTENRFTDDDRRLSLARMTETVRGWRLHPAMAQQRDTTNMVLTLVRVGAHAVGLSVHDMRDSEVEWLQTAARELLSAVLR